MRFSSTVHDRHRHHHPSRPWSWSLSLGSIQIAEGQAATVGDADAAVDAVIDELPATCRPFEWRQ